MVRREQAAEHEAGAVLPIERIYVADLWEPERNLDHAKAYARAVSGDDIVVQLPIVAAIRAFR